MRLAGYRVARGDRWPFPRRAGFSLLEIIIVLSLSAIVVGGGIVVMNSRSNERSLLEAAGELETLARRARTISVVQQTPYVVALTKEGFHLHPWAEEGLDEAEIVELDLRETRDREPVRDMVPLDPEFTSEVLRWGATQWIPLVRDERQVWRFDPNGLCEPLSVRFRLGESWIQHEYHPLTASVRDQQMEARGE